MGEYLSNEVVNELIKKIKTGDEAAWEVLYKNFDLYIHECAWKRLRKLDMTEAYRKDLEEDLYMAGWQGFVSAIRNYASEKGKLLTYATSYIDGEISKELDRLLNPLGITSRPKNTEGSKNESVLARISLDEYPERLTSSDTAEKLSEINVDAAPDRGKYNAERRTLQILEILRFLTDEEHTISKDELNKMLKLYRAAKYDNGTPVESPNVITSTLESILAELNPLEYTESNDAEYKIRYEGYKEDRLKKKLNKEKGKKAANITNFSYVHTFNNNELDKLLQLVSFSDMLSTDEKTVLIRKLVGTASVNYRSPFWDGESLKFNPKAVHSRLNIESVDDRNHLSENLKMIQLAVNNMAQIRFRFDRYTEEHGKKMPSSSYMHELSPYHLVCYHDQYYCIGLKKDDRRIWHYRVDLMSDVEIIRDEKGEFVPIEVSAFAGLPIANAAWNPGKYMAEHLNMAYDEPQDIRIKIRNTDYTIIHDWFGNHYEKVDDMTGTDDKGEEVQYDIVKVRTSPTMMVHWAMQYGSRVEIMEEEIRERIRTEVERMRDIYEKA